MCGFAGFLSLEPEALDSGAVLRKMTGLLEHRGPDAEGFFEEEGIHLGHRRLRVIDLEAGQQPFVMDSGVLAFNGEIYNYRELRAELEAEGISFHSESDTEVLARGLVRYGSSYLSRLNGMFSFAFWNRSERSLLLGRDRMGQKPLYFYPHKNGVVFASELTALLAFPSVPRDVSSSALRKYFLFDYVPSPGSIVAGVHRLEAGTWKCWSPRGEEIGRYWDFQPSPQSGGSLEELDELLSDSVRLRLRSDVPLGIFLSGGLDSSALVSLASRHLPVEELHTFSIGFEEASFDESSHASRVATHFGTQHHERILSTEEMLRVLPKALGHLDEPMADGSFLPTYLLSEFAREKVTVALGGDGGDELFMGYPTFQAHQLARMVNGLPRGFWSHAMEPMLRLLPVSTKNISLDYKLKRFAQGMRADPFSRHFIWIGGLAPWLHSSLFQENILESTTDEGVFEDVERWVGHAPWSDPMRTLSALYSRFYLGDDILVKVDRASMAHGLEARSPFLDPRVVDAVFGLETHQKHRGNDSKIALRQLMKTSLPPEILARPKKGFGMPIAQWLQGPLAHWAREMLAPERLRPMGIFQEDAGHAFLDAHQAGKADHRKVLWSLLVFVSWWERNLAP